MILIHNDFNTTQNHLNPNNQRKTPYDRFKSQDFFLFDQKPLKIAIYNKASLQKHFKVIKN